MDYELSAWILIGVLFLVTVVLLILRARRPKPVKPQRHVDRVSVRRTTACKKEEEKPVVPDLPFYDVERPGVLVFMNAQGQAKLLFQRAQVADDAFFRSLTEDKAVLQAFNPIVTHVNALNGAAQTGLCNDLYTINFVRDVTETDEHLTTRALTTHGQPMGECLKESISASMVEKLRELTKRAGIDRELKMAIDRECLGLEKALSRASLLLESERKTEWKARLSEIKALMLSDDQTESSPDINHIQTLLHVVDDSLGSELATLSDSVKDLASADDALTRAIPLIEERELIVRSLFLLSIIKISKDESYFSGLQSISRLVKSTKTLHGVERLLENARHVIFELAEKSGREMKDEELTLLRQVKKEIEELRRVAVATRSRLREECAYLQAVVDDYLIHCNMEPRYALRVNEDGRISALMFRHRHREK